MFPQVGMILKMANTGYDIAKSAVNAFTSS